MPEPMTMLARVAAAIRLTADGSEPAEPVRTVLEGIVAAATLVVNQQAALAPQDVKDEAIVRVSGWLYDTRSLPEDLSLIHI